MFRRVSPAEAATGMRSGAGHQDSSLRFSVPVEIKYPTPVG